MNMNCFQLIITFMQPMSLKPKHATQYNDYLQPPPYNTQNQLLTPNDENTFKLNNLSNPPPIFPTLLCS